MAKVVHLSRAPVLGDGAEPASPTPVAGTVGDVLAAAAEGARAGVRGAMATVVERAGSSPATPGQKIYLGGDGRCVGTVGGGALEQAVLRELAAVVASSEPSFAVREYALGPELGMCCGGRARLLLESIEGRTACCIVGAGHVATALAPLLDRVGFAVTVCDAREGWAEGERIPGATLVLGEHDEAFADAPAGAVFLVMTHDHALDQAAIEWALRRGFAFVGGIGSRAKAARVRDRLEAKGFSPEDRARVRMPLGLSIGARLPDEIAIAVCAELVEWRRSAEKRRTIAP
ncbi:MAG: XdhC family protein [Myxococcales bacterium]|nr:XdhC family protein [Myxococcales bacterium]